MPGSCFQAYTPTPAIQHSESTSQSRSKRLRQFIVVPIRRSYPAPALRERRHCSLARRLVAVRRARDATSVVAAGPHPRTTLRRSRNREDAADDHPVLQHVVVLLVVADGRALEGQRGHSCLVGGSLSLRWPPAAASVARSSARLRNSSTFTRTAALSAARA